MRNYFTSLRLTQPKRETSELSERARLLEQTHLLGHFGIDALIRALQSRGIVWPGMGEEAKATVDECTICQRYTIAKRGFHPYTYIMAKLPMDHVAMDLFEFPKSTAGYCLVLVEVDICTRFTFLRALKHKDMASVAKMLYKLFLELGFPRIIQYDNGTR